jgi:hypothetical protein
MNKTRRTIQGAEIMIFAAIIGGGCWHQSSNPAAAELLKQQSSLGAPALAVANVNLQPGAEAEATRAAETMDPGNDPGRMRPVTECSAIGVGRSFTQFSTPWPEPAR